MPPSTQTNTYKLQTSTSGPYSFPGIKSSGAAYSGLPQCVCSRLPGLAALLRPKSAQIILHVDFLGLFSFLPTIFTCLFLLSSKMFSIFKSLWTPSAEAKVKKVIDKCKSHLLVPINDYARLFHTTLCGHNNGRQWYTKFPLCGIGLCRHD